MAEDKIYGRNPVLEAIRHGREIDKILIKKGGIDGSVNVIVKKAKDLGLKNTHYVNCNGLPEEGHYSCARDIAVISRELLLKHPAITKYTTIWMDYLRIH